MHFDVAEKFGHPLHLVHGDGRGVDRKEEATVRTGLLFEEGIVEREIAAEREELAQEGGFADLPRAGHEDGLVRGGQAGKMGFDGAVEVVHGKFRFRFQICQNLVGAPCLKSRKQCKRAEMSGYFAFMASKTGT